MAEKSPVILHKLCRIAPGLGVPASSAWGAVSEMSPQPGAAPSLALCCCAHAVAAGMVPARLVNRLSRHHGPAPIQSASAVRERTFGGPLHRRRGITLGVGLLFAQLRPRHRPAYRNREPSGAAVP